MLHADLLNQIPERVRAKVQAAFDQLQVENRLLLEALRLERIRKFGPKSEQFSGELLSLLNLEPVVAGPEVEAEAARPQAVERSEEQPRVVPVRAALPASLPREKLVVAVPAAECLCGQCGGEKKVIGYERSERLNLRPAEYYVLETLREKRACPKCEERVGERCRGSRKHCGKRDPRRRSGGGCDFEEVLRPQSVLPAGCGD
jgi:transposase